MKFILMTAHPISDPHENEIYIRQVFAPLNKLISFGKILTSYEEPFLRKEENFSLILVECHAINAALNEQEMEKLIRAILLQQQDLTLDAISSQFLKKDTPKIKGNSSFLFQPTLTKKNSDTPAVKSGLTGLNLIYNQSNRL